MRLVFQPEQYIPAFQSEQLGLMFRLEHFGTGGSVP